MSCSAIILEGGHRGGGGRALSLAPWGQHIVVYCTYVLCHSIIEKGFIILVLAYLAGHWSYMQVHIHADALRASKYF